MVSSKNRNNLNFVRIVVILRGLRECGMISDEEFRRAKDYYEKVTGADIAVYD